MFPGSNADFNFTLVCFVICNFSSYRCDIRQFQLMAMENYTNEQRIVIVDTIYKNNERFTELVRKLGFIFGR